MRTSPDGPWKIYALFALVCLLSLGFPIYPLAASRAPVLVAGIPFALWWNVAWVTASFLALIVLDRIAGDTP